jgi:hypothetical protein
VKKEYKRIIAKDLRLRPQELCDQLKEYITQLIPSENLTDKLTKMIEEDSYQFVLHCLWNFKQK